MKKKQIVRIKFNEVVFERDHHKCAFCDETENLDAHHITDRHDMPNGGYVKENGITLCEDHHYKAERFHATCGEDWFADMHPDDLYRKIGSNYQKAVEASKRLK